MPNIIGDIILTNRSNHSFIYPKTNTKSSNVEFASFIVAMQHVLTLLEVFLIVRRLFENELFRGGSRGGGWSYGSGLPPFV